MNVLIPVGIAFFFVVIVVVLLMFRNNSGNDNESDNERDTDTAETESESDEENEPDEENESDEENEPEQETPPEDAGPSVDPIFPEDTTMANKETARMCVYTNQYERCDTQCGPGKQFRVQVPYDTNKHDENEAHECVPDEDREFSSCTGIVCDDTYTMATFLENNPGAGWPEYCQFIVENDACDDNFVEQNNLCATQCPR